MRGKGKQMLKGMMPAMLAFIFMSAVPVQAEELFNGLDNSTRMTIGCASMMDNYYEAVDGGERHLYHLRTGEGNLEEAKNTALESYSNLGIVDIGRGYLNVRQTPDNKGTVIGKMTDGCAGEIIGEENDWYHISSGEVDGYVSKEFVKAGDEAKEKALEAMELRIQINTETLNVRTEPREDAPMWTQVNEKERYAVIQDLGDWIQIELDTAVGYVSSEYVTVKFTLDKAVKVEVVEKRESDSGSTGSRANRQDIVDYAMQFLGNPYVWGGESLTDGCDCSGFTMLIYRKFGISLPHYSVDQSRKGTRISSDQLKKGDLIFYAGSDGTINHVTMYIGNGQIIGAQSRRSGICIKNWDYRTPVRIVNLLD